MFRNTGRTPGHGGPGSRGPAPTTRARRATPEAATRSRGAARAIGGWLRRAGFAALLLGGAAIPPAHAVSRDSLFQTFPRSYPTATSPVAVEIADLDHDGRPDLVTTNVGDVVSVLLARAEGGLSSPATYATGHDPGAIAIGDFDGDGHADLAVANSSVDPDTLSRVSVLLGVGDGTFRARTDFVTGPYSRAVVAGDFNEDGRLDLAVTNSGGYPGPPASLTILVGNGDGTFGGRMDYATGRYPMAVATADLDGDGHLDLAVANFGSYPSVPPTVSVLRGDGAGGFGSRADFVTGSDPFSLAIADLNEDGAPDLALAGNGGVSILSGEGDGTFGELRVVPVGSINSDLAIGDVDQDGHLDLVVATSVYLVIPIAYEDYVCLFFGDGTGAFSPAIGAWSFDFGMSAEVRSVAVGDLTFDGMPDLAVTRGSDRSVAVFESKGLFGPPVDYPIGGSAIALLLADFDRDGDQDLATGNQAPGTASLLMGRGDGTFDPATEVPLATCLASLVAADLDGNGAPDLVATDECATSLWVRLGIGDGTFGPDTPYPTNHELSRATAGDLNGDGHPDVALAHEYENQLSVMLGGGDGSFGPATSFAAVEAPTALAIADLDRDGRPDLVVTLCNLEPGIAIFPGNGDGTFGAPRHVATANCPVSLAIADLDRDGMLDVVAGNVSGQSPLSVHLGNGDGTFRPTIEVATGRRAVAMAVGDLNRDGKPDLITTDPPRDGSLVLLGNGDGTFGSRFEIPSGPWTSGVAIADLDRDGRPDAITATISGKVSVFLSTRTALTAVDETGVAGLATFRLAPPRPNPSRGSSEFRWTLAATAEVEVTVFDIAGRRLRTLVDRRTFAPGEHRARWDGTDESGSLAPAGVYLVRVRAGRDARVSRFALVR